MSGAGDVKNRDLEFTGREEAESFRSQNPAVRFYSRNGVMWTVHRTRADSRRGWKGALVSARMRIRQYVSAVFAKLSGR